MQKILKYIYAAALLSSGQCALGSEENIDLNSSPDDLTQHMDNYYGLVIRTEHAVTTQEPIRVNIGGYLGQILKKDGNQITACFNCSINPDNVTEAIIKNYELSPGNITMIKVQFDPESNSSIVSQLKESGLVSSENIWAPDNNDCWGALGEDVLPEFNFSAPTYTRVGVGTLLGTPEEIIYSLKDDGSIAPVTLTTTFQHLQTLQENVANVNTAIENQKEGLAEEVGNTLSEQFSDFQKKFLHSFNEDSTVLDTRNRKYLKEQLSLSVSDVKENLTRQTVDLTNSFEKMLADNAVSQGGTLVHNLNTMKEDVALDIKQQTVDINAYNRNVMESLLGLKLGTGPTIVQKLTQLTSLHRPCQDFNSYMEQISHTYMGYAPFYADNIMMLLEGALAPEDNATALVQSVPYYINSTLVALHAITFPIPESILQTLESVQHNLSHLKSFFQTYDLHQEPKLLGYLKLVFGPKLPANEPSGAGILQYCNAAVFSETDYGMYAWAKSLYTLASGFSSVGSIPLQQEAFITKIQNIIAGKAAKDTINGITYPHVIPDYLYNGLQDYPSILNRVDTLVTHIEKKDLANRMEQGNKNLLQAMQVLYRSQKEEFKALQTELKKRYDENRYLIHRFTKLDIGKPQGEEMVKAYNQILDGVSQHDLPQHIVHALLEAGLLKPDLPDDSPLSPNYPPCPCPPHHCMGK